MKRKRRPWRFWPLVLVLWAAGAAAGEQFGFNPSEYEKKAFELNGYAELKQEHFALNPDGAFYRLMFLGEPQRETLDRTTGTVELAGRWRHGIGTFDFRTNSLQQSDQLASGGETRIFDAAYALRPDPGLTVEAGKRALSWGKGYAFNPIGFVQRAKDPNDPQLAREGFVMADADWITSPGGALQTVALTPVLLPVSGDINNGFGAPGHLNPAAKLYLLYRNTDIDLAWQGAGSRPARYGADFARNVTSNFEVHGEWARIGSFTLPVTDDAGRVTTQTGAATSWLLGLRYLTVRDTTYIAEYYRNGTGYSEDEFRDFYALVDAAFATENTALEQKVLALSQASYGRPNAGTDYFYLRAQQKDAFGIVYFQPAITFMMNAQDHSYQFTPELDYTGIKNLELRGRIYLLEGASNTEFGEKQASRKLEIFARYYF